jgi:hypothetical protein
MDATVGRFGSRTEAEMARGLLDSAGIPTRIRADDAGALHPELGQVGSHSGITLVVADEHAAEARQFLDAYAAGPIDSGSSEGVLSEDGSTDTDPPRGGRRGLQLIVALMLVLMLGLALSFNVLDVVTGIG